MKTILRTALLVAVIFALAVAVDSITPLKRFTADLARHPEPYRSVMAGLAIAGWVLLLAMFATLLSAQGRPMSEDQARDFMRNGGGRSGHWRVFRGRAAGREFRGTASFAEIKEAVRSGAWVREPGWRPLFAGLLGLALAIYGMFGYFFVIGPPLVKLMTGGALAYATARTIWGFWRA